MTAAPANDAPPSEALAEPRRYAGSQIALHWIIALLVLGQYLFADAMAQAWRAWRQNGEAAPPETPIGATMHAVFGLSIFLLALLRLGVRLKRGAPPIPATHPAPARFLAYATHFALYAFLLLMPVSGAAAWFGGVEQAAAAHVVAKNALLAFVALHVLGAAVEVAWFGRRPARQMVTLGASG